MTERRNHIATIEEQHAAAVAENDITCPTAGDVVITLTAEDDERQRRSACVDDVIVARKWLIVVGALCIQHQEVVLACGERDGNVVVAESCVQRGDGAHSIADQSSVDRDDVVTRAGPKCDAVRKAASDFVSAEGDDARSQAGNENLCIRHSRAGEVVGDDHACIARRCGLVGNHQRLTTGSAVDIQVPADAVEIAVQVVESGYVRGLAVRL